MQIPFKKISGGRKKRRKKLINIDSGTVRKRLVKEVMKSKLPLIKKKSFKYGKWDVWRLGCFWKRYKWRFVLLGLVIHKIDCIAIYVNLLKKHENSLNLSLGCSFSINFVVFAHVGEYILLCHILIDAPIPEWRWKAYLDLNRKKVVLL